MAEVQHFRTQFRGFHREDVVNYIEYLNNYYASQLQQMSAQLEDAMQHSHANEELIHQLEAAEYRCAQLEKELAELRMAPPAANIQDKELEAYRRAERTERVARERAQQIYAQANAVLADVATKAGEASAHVAAFADQVSANLQDTKEVFEDAVATLYAICPQE